MNAPQKVYLLGPADLTALVVSRIRAGEIRAVNIDGGSIERDFRELPWEQFVARHLEPAFAQLFAD